MRHDVESRDRCRHTQSGGITHENRSQIVQQHKGLQRRYSQNWSLPTRISTLLIARTYSAYSKGRKDPRENFQKCLTNREWWRTTLKDTPVPGRYDHTDFIQENDARNVKQTYNFKGLGRRKTATEHNQGKLLIPGLYTYPDMMSMLEKQQATCAFKSSGRKYNMAGYQDKHLHIAPWQYDVKRDPKPVQRGRPTSAFKSQSKRFTFVTGDGPPLGTYEVGSLLDKVHSVQSSFKSTTKRPCNIPNKTKVPGPGFYEPTTGQGRDKNGKYKAPQTILNVGRQHAIFYPNAFDSAAR